LGWNNLPCDGINQSHPILGHAPPKLKSIQCRDRLRLDAVQRRAALIASAQPKTKEGKCSANRSAVNSRTPPSVGENASDRGWQTPLPPSCRVCRTPLLRHRTRSGRSCCKPLRKVAGASNLSVELNKFAESVARKCLS